jgi:hypothetical protein
MAENGASSVAEDVEHFVGSFSAFHQAMPDENQHILRQVMAQVMGAGKTREGFLRGGAGLEPIWTIEKSGVEVSKRVFHPGRGEHAIGADFMISKKVTSGLTGITLVQVKRTGETSFTSSSNATSTNFIGSPGGGEVHTI